MVAVFTLLTVGFPCRGSHAQTSARDSQTAAGEDNPSFDVISIKADRNVNGSPSSFGPTGGSLFSATNERPLDLIAFAYNLSGYYYRAIIPQLPAWANTQRFDVQARAAGKPTRAQMQLMVRSLLAERFKFAAHYEDRRTSFYALVLVKSEKLGPQLRRFGNEEPCPTPPPTARTVGGGFPALCGIPQILASSQPELFREGARNVSMEQLATYMTAIGELDRPVFNRTGLSGNFDLIIEFDRKANGNPAADTAGATFLEALRDQLGLKLDAQTGPVETLIVDHIDEPSPN
jgi:uncharacterized protein (TIGR03435 family)